MNRTKILVIEKDLIARRAISKMLCRELNYKISFVRDDRSEVESVIENENPDIILLNLEGDNSADLVLLGMIRIRYPDLPVIVTSPRNRRGAKKVIAALRMGAVDFLTKPEHSNNLLFAGHHLRKRLIPMLKYADGIRDSGMLNRKLAMHVNTDLDFRKDASSGQHEYSGRWFRDLVVVGGCTGGPKALFSIIPQLPKEFPVPIVVVQHLPKIYTAVLAEILEEMSDISVNEIADEDSLKPGTVWIAPGGYHLEIRKEGNRQYFKTHRGPRVQGVRPAIDVTFKSASDIFKNSVLGVVLSGCGTDGLEGARAIHRAGGEIIVQDPRTALAVEMPLAVINADIHDGIYPVNELSDRIANRVLNEQRPEKSPRPISRDLTTGGSFPHFEMTLF